MTTQDRLVAQLHQLALLHTALRAAKDALPADVDPALRAQIDEALGFSEGDGAVKETRAPTVPDTVAVGVKGKGSAGAHVGGVEVQATDTVKAYETLAVGVRDVQSGEVIPRDYSDPRWLEYLARVHKGLAAVDGQPAPAQELPGGGV